MAANEKNNLTLILQREDISDIHDDVVNELLTSVEDNSQTRKKKNKKKKKKKKTKKYKKNESSSNVDDSDVDPFDNVLHDAVRDTHLDNMAENQLKELAEIQKELLKLQQSSDEGMSSDNEEEDNQYNPPSNQQAHQRANREEVKE